MSLNNKLQKLPPLVFKSHHPRSNKVVTLELPIINGGMGVGVTGPTLAAAVTNAGGGGILTGVALGYPFQKILKKYVGEKPYQANKMALNYWIHDAKEKSNNRFVGVNLMVVVHDFKDLAYTSAKAGVDLIIAGAGLPMALPDIVSDFPDTMIAPIISSAKAARVMVKKWLNKKRPPDAIIYESVHHSGGHQGAVVKDILSGKHQPEEVIGETRKILDDNDLSDVPVIAAGGVWFKDDIIKYMSWGAQGVQMASRFLITKECGHEFGGIKLFKKLYKSNVVPTILEHSPAGLPGRAVPTPFSSRFSYENEKIIPEPHECAAVCLSSCDKKNSIYCILYHLTETLRDNYEEGLFFAGTNVGRPDLDKTELTVEELMKRLAVGESNPAIVQVV
tara:strand:- start:242653 stop:243825 length:1173 start_codon:yes stop_codon:yes gene_type:complete